MKIALVDDVVLPQGFRAAGIASGIKRSGKRDLMLVVSDRPATCAGVFTTNQVQAAPVKLDREVVKNQSARAIVVNSGNANACTGASGLRDAKAMQAQAAKLLKVKAGEVLVCSTGAIGKPMPMNTIRAGIQQIVPALSADGGPDAALAIMTTDTRKKTATVRLAVDGKPVTLTAFAKGAGMIEPNMATMLGFFFTDAAVEPRALQHALKQAVDASFNRVSVDGDMSTNDTCLFLANGAAGNKPLTPKHKDWPAFTAALFVIALDLATKIAADGEGATKLVTVRVEGARSDAEADAAARAVANSMLVKTCWNGDYPNWGRIMDAIGYSAARVDESKVDIFYDARHAVRRGLATRTSIAALSAVQKQKQFTIRIDLHLGKGQAEVYTCDCSEEYVRINVDYIKMPDGREPT
ncbi:MAG: bifunctional glutamate N-acetyltransferase/amino-acid acetyltransferase ArgJ [Kiritimatiellae bacterium]|nr:bifunctional glutamate N-acetyltransferase/amino-acid acetyltransferase ArgJ [Kiritimatiellia bacterium]MCO5062367.1 bifunctional glutamate N-acetyltransferase/amino-acid acetyltransferase ArgJ [Kiritimatiellia bacterium]MCO6400583.1 bifunctional glutamate N-acetyltransferase/amino-acid acetyltransferase ArgJ [Verrucomicrobiota bacterium]